MPTPVKSVEFSCWWLEQLYFVEGDIENNVTFTVHFEYLILNIK